MPECFVCKAWFHPNANENPTKRLDLNFYFFISGYSSNLVFLYRFFVTQAKGRIFYSSYIRAHLKNLCRGGWKRVSEYIYENKAVTLLWPSSFSANSLYAPANLKRLLLFWWIFIRASCSCKVRKDQRNILKSIENRLVSTENWISLIGVFVLVLVHLWLYRFPGFLMGKGFCHSEFLSNRLFFVTY